MMSDKTTPDSPKTAKPVRRVVIVGGGAAGWLTAGVLAAEFQGNSAQPLHITLVESPDVPILGVGEGTWPSMRMTLQRIGISEAEFIRTCDASFKQGTRFVDWRAPNTQYLHPFSLPPEYSQLNLANFWLAESQRGSQHLPAFAHSVTPQAAVIDAGRAPKQATTPEYAFNLNYGYHLNAGKFAELLRRHGVEALGVQHRLARVTEVVSDPGGDVQALQLDTGEQLAGDLFIDCSGSRSLLIGEHFRTPFISLKASLANDRALAIGVPYAKADAPIAPTTHSTALSNGWVWDIGLQSRRGVGFVYASEFSGEGAACEQLAAYLTKTAPHIKINEQDFRQLKFNPGHYESFWVQNCVAVGMAAGFVEPLEASALALVEQSAAFIAEQLPSDSQKMAPVARRFNQKMRYHWQGIADFLKLHYVLNQRASSDYWRTMGDRQSCSAALADKLLLWEQQPPWHEDAPRIDELFPSASYQFVLYGMGFMPQHLAATVSRPRLAAQWPRARQLMQDVHTKAVAMTQALETNRALLNKITAKANS
ncbi:tryptophan 7-halogenase [Simiduia sp. 21SJ11W-1]|uniref:tryptophan halogenase family protein n=1 Tax=Simiduia sp. 21SJ11W-1 TaxID=2909669 RepID=UPI0020A20392|nr:tryptophan halogenase family protein [Simiduia sp. 21SJ11W-1]UTA47168.1 tryptophan 7-halogenase [Simiduia sp. 21SJ11W-1]